LLGSVKYGRLCREGLEFVTAKTVDNLNVSWVGGGFRRRRWLTFCLLFLVAYGSTADAIHHHGNLIAGTSVKAESSIRNADSDLTSNKILTENDCTICQLQRNIQAGLLYSQVSVIAPVTQSRSESAKVLSYLFAFHAQQRGRAPPENT
jgi:hypothetical protein